MKRFLCLLVLVGCAETETLYKPVSVEVPVAVPCAVEVAKPVWPLATLSEKAGLFEKVQAVLVENEERQAYEAQLEAAMVGCR